jgi:hypothetical protein
MNPLPQPDSQGDEVTMRGLLTRNRLPIAVVLGLIVLRWSWNVSHPGDRPDRDGQEPAILVGHTDDPSNLPPGMKLVPDRPSDAPDRVDRTPRVSDDAAQMDDTRRRAREEADVLYQSALDAVRKGDNLYLEHLGPLEQRRPQAVEDLKHILADTKSVPAQARARAAYALMRLAEPSGERFLFDSLGDPSPELRAASLQMLEEWDVHPDFHDPQRVERVLAFVDDPNADTSRCAYRLAARQKLPGTEAKLVELLTSGRAKDLDDVARSLADVVEDPQNVRVMLEARFRDRPADYGQFFGLDLEQLIERSKPEVGELVRSEFRKFLLGYTGQARYEQHYARDLALVADGTTVPVLKDIVANARDPVSRIEAKVALARLDPDHAVDRLLDFIEPGRPYSSEVAALQLYATERDADRIIASLIDGPRKAGRDVISLEVTRLLLEKLGARGRAVVERSMDHLEPRARMFALWKIRGIDLRDLLDDLQAAGVVTTSSEALIEQRRQAVAKHPFSSEPLDTSNPESVIEALGQAGILTGFDVETGVLPCGHHRLILDFAANSTGRFHPECAVEIWHRKNEEDFEAPYTVRFIDRGRLYTFGAENHGDWYDVEAVVQAINFALETAGKAERFIALDGDGQVALYVLADPKAFRPIAAKYALPLSDEPDKAMRDGKAFEQKVIEQFSR